MIYTDLHSLELSDSDIWRAIRSNDIEILILLPMQLGFCHENWKFIQDICVLLSEHENESVRGNAFYGFAYAAMKHRKLEKYVVKPVLLRGLKDASEYVHERALIAVSDVNAYMKWKIGSAPKNKAREKRYYSKKSDKS